MKKGNFDETFSLKFLLNNFTKSALLNNFYDIRAAIRTIIP